MYENKNRAILFYFNVFDLKIKKKKNVSTLKTPLHYKIRNLKNSSFIWKTMECDTKVTKQF